MNSHIPRNSYSNPGFFEVFFCGQPVQAFCDFGTEYNYLLKDAADEFGIPYANPAITKSPRILTDYQGKAYYVVGTTDEIKFDLNQDTVGIYANIIVERNEKNECVSCELSRPWDILIGRRVIRGACTAILNDRWC